jgi:hypothetical protein
VQATKERRTVQRKEKEDKAMRRKGHHFLFFLNPPLTISGDKP